MLRLHRILPLALLAALFGCDEVDDLKKELEALRDDVRAESEAWRRVSAAAVADATNAIPGGYFNLLLADLLSGTDEERAAAVAALQRLELAGGGSLSTLPPTGDWVLSLRLVEGLDPAVRVAVGMYQDTSNDPEAFEQRVESDAFLFNELTMLRATGVPRTSDDAWEEAERHIDRLAIYMAGEPDSRRTGTSNNNTVVYEVFHNSPLFRPTIQGQVGPRARDAAVQMETNATKAIRSRIKADLTNALRALYESTELPIEGREPWSRAWQFDGRPYAWILIPEEDFGQFAPDFRLLGTIHRQGNPNEICVGCGSTSDSGFTLDMGDFCSVPLSDGDCREHQIVTDREGKRYVTATPRVGLDQSFEQLLDRRREMNDLVKEYIAVLDQEGDDAARAKLLEMVQLVERR